LGGLHQGRILILRPGVLHEKHTVRSDMWVPTKIVPRTKEKQAKP
jgi:hypothetical protein